MTCGGCADYPCDNSGGHLKTDKACDRFKPTENSKMDIEELRALNLKNVVDDSKDGCVEVPRLIIFKDRVIDQIKYIINWLTMDDAPKSDRSQRVNIATANIIRDIDSEYCINSMTKTATALLRIGVLNFHRMFEDNELEELHKKIKQRRNEIVKENHRKVDFLESAKKDFNYSLPGAGFRDIFGKNRTKGTTTIHYYQFPQLANTLQQLNDFGFDAGNPCEFLIYLAINCTEYANEREIDDTVSSIVEPIINLIKLV